MPDVTAVEWDAYLRRKLRRLMQKKYFIQQYLHQNYRHGGIGLVDAEKTLLSEGYEPILLPHQQNFSIAAKLSRFLYLCRIIHRIPKGSVVVFLFPLYARMTQLLVRFLWQRKSIRLICFITDIDGIKDGNVKKLEKDISFFRKLIFFIVHNRRMSEWLNAKIKKAICSEIEFFDFLAQPAIITSEFSANIVFAGNLEKSPFLEKLYLLKDKQPGIHFHLYGPNQTPAMQRQENASWHGIEKPGHLPARLQGSFGLVWDSGSLDCIDGSLGQYMNYISNHKLSLYILSKLPIIVPAGTAASDLVEKYQIGFAVNNLHELEKKINSISVEDYRQMQKNMQPLAEKISTGGCIREALQKLLPVIK